MVLGDWIDPWLTLALSSPHQGYCSFMTTELLHFLSLGLPWRWDSSRGCDRWAKRHAIHAHISNDLKVVKTNEILIDQMSHQSAALLQVQHQTRRIPNWKTSMQQQLATWCPIGKAMHKTCAQLGFAAVHQLRRSRDTVDGDSAISSLRAQAQLDARHRPQLLLQATAKGRTPSHSDLNHTRVTRLEGLTSVASVTIFQHHVQCPGSETAKKSRVASICHHCEYP